MSDHLVLNGLDAKLIVMSGERRGLSIVLNKPRLIIGRGPDCDLQLQDDQCSRHHAAILCDEYTVRVRDLGSLNGTFVNGTLIQSTTILNEFDKIRVGQTAMTIQRHGVAQLRSISDAPTDVVSPGGTKIHF